MKPIFVGSAGPDGMSGPYLLMSFFKNWKTPQGAIHWKWIKCHIWFSTIEEITAFVKSNQEVENYVPENFDKENSERWPDFYTMYIKFEK